jgi:hypothetical protein
MTYGSRLLDSCPAGLGGVDKQKLRSEQAWASRAG